MFTKHFFRNSFRSFDLLDKISAFFTSDWNAYFLTILLLISERSIRTNSSIDPHDSSNNVHTQIIIWLNN